MARTRDAAGTESERRQWRGWWWWWWWVETQSADGRAWGKWWASRHRTEAVRRCLGLLSFEVMSMCINIKHIHTISCVTSLLMAHMGYLEHEGRSCRDLVYCEDE